MESALQSVYTESRARSAEPRVMSLTEYMEGCRTNPRFYATAAQRLLAAIGKPILIETKDDPRLGRIFDNRKIKTYERFADFYGIEHVIEQLVRTLTEAAQGLEPDRQIIYLLGPPGSSKSSIAERLKQLMQKEPMYALAVPDTRQATGYALSPLFESPLGIFPGSSGAALAQEFGIPRRHLNGLCSPWAAKRLQELGGDMSQFKVVEIYPSLQRGIGIATVAPGDENNQDISDLVGKVDLRMLEQFPPYDPDAYSYASGGLCVASHGMLDFVEMFKAPIKTLHPLLTATADRMFKGSEGNLVMPFRGIIIAHSNESEWDKFRSNKNNEAFLDRVCLLEVPYNLRLTEEQRIYRKVLDASELGVIPEAPHTLELLARVVVGSRMSSVNTVAHHHKIIIYDGRDLRGEVANAPTLFDLRKAAKEGDAKEGFWGISTRTAFKVLGAAANAGDEIGLDPVQLYEMLRRTPEIVGTEGTPAFLESTIDRWLMKAIDAEVREALLENFRAFGQRMADRYFYYADMWRNPDLGAIPDPDTNVMLTKDDVLKRLKEIEEPAKIENPESFRGLYVEYVLRYKARNAGAMPGWETFSDMKRVIERLIVKQTENELPYLSFAPHKDAEGQKKHDAFVERMMQKGYTRGQVQRVVMWWQARRAKS